MSKRIIVTLIAIVAIFTGCSSSPEYEYIDNETKQTFNRLFGDQYIYTMSGEKEWFFHDNNKEGYVEVIDYSSRKTWRFESTIPLRFSADKYNPRLLANVQRKHQIKESTANFQYENVSFIIREDSSLLISEGDASGNITRERELTPLSVSAIPQINHVISSAQALSKVVGEDEVFYLTHDFTVSAITDNVLYLYKYGEIARLPLSGEMPSLVGYSFSDTYDQVVQDKADTFAVLEAYGLAFYDNIIMYGDYYLCIDNDGVAQLLYNKETNFYEWMAG